MAKNLVNTLLSRKICMPFAVTAMVEGLAEQSAAKIEYAIRTIHPGYTLSEEDMLFMCALSKNLGASDEIERVLCAQFILCLFLEEQQFKHTTKPKIDAAGKLRAAAKDAMIKLHGRRYTDKFNPKGTML